MFSVNLLIQYLTDTWHDHLDPLGGLQTGEPITFSFSCKEMLLAKQLTCRVCWKPMEHGDNAAIAHIPDYWRASLSKFQKMLALSIDLPD